MASPARRGREFPGFPDGCGTRPRFRSRARRGCRRRRLPGSASIPPRLSSARSSRLRQELALAPAIAPAHDLQPAVAPDRQPGPAVAIEKADLPLASTLVNATIKPVSCNQLRGQLAPCQGNSDAHGWDSGGDGRVSSWSRYEFSWPLGRSPHDDKLSGKSGEIEETERRLVGPSVAFRVSSLATMPPITRHY